MEYIVIIPAIPFLILSIYIGYQQQAFLYRNGYISRYKRVTLRRLDDLSRQISNRQHVRQVKKLRTVYVWYLVLFYLTLLLLLYFILF